MGFGVDAVPQLAAAIMRNAVAATEPGKPYLLFAMQVDLDDAELGQLRFFSDEIGHEAEAAARFLTSAGLAEQENVQELVQALAQSIVQRVHALGPEAELAVANTMAAQQAGSAAPAATPDQSIEPQGGASPQTIAPGTMVQASFVIGGTAYDLEFPAGSAADTLAAEFCSASWEELAPAINAELGDSHAIVQDQCAEVLAELLLAKLG